MQSGQWALPNDLGDHPRCRVITCSTAYLLNGFRYGRRGKVRQHALDVSVRDGSGDGLLLALVGEVTLVEHGLNMGCKEPEARL